MNKRDLVLSLLDPGSQPEKTPAAFFLHFDPIYHRGQGAVDKHLEYFRYTDMDFVKIQYERNFPHLPEIQQPEDWAKMPFYGLDFYADQLGVVEGLVKAAKREALVLITLYSPFMCAGQTTSDEIISEHINRDPEAVQRGMQIITDSLMLFVKECIRLGVDGFYTSTQGGEFGRLRDRSLFDACIRPYDLALMAEANRSCIFNILHVCDYRLPYDDLSPYVDYPGHIVNASLELTGGRLTPQEVERMFGRPFMGGLDRKGVLATGSPQAIQAAAEDVLHAAPQRFMLGADCTLPYGTGWDNLKTAISAAHAHHPG
ncbi:MAG: uroporphyrinogen decarboxylase family protein [Anaerolineaceae bacterium]|nr:uroporphyrinogen decarboxylase family protein [Anaerolineaceae bacterium]